MKWSFPTLMVSLLLLTIAPLNAQEGWRLQGTVLDAVNADPLPGAAVFLDGSGVLTDLDGRFTFTGTEPGDSPSVLRVRYIGYVETSQNLDAWEATRPSRSASNPTSPASAPPWSPRDGTSRTSAK